MHYDILYAFVLATAALAISPGPDNIYVLTQSIANGKKDGLATTAGLISGCLVHTTLLAFGVSALIKNNPNLFFTLKLFGAFYLFFLAFKVLKNPSSLIFSNQAPKKSLGRLYRQGFVMNVLNPKVTIFFLAFFPAFLFSNFIPIVLQFYALGLLFMMVSFLVFGLIAFLAGSISETLKKRPAIGRGLKWLQIVVFIGIGIYLLIG